MERRDNLILELIQRHVISDQGQLLRLLEQHGTTLTQSVLSRRLKDLGITKKHGRYVAMTVASLSIVQRFVLSPPNLILIHTMPGHAGGLAYQIDEQQFPDIAGTISGDDVVMIALVEGASIQEVVEILQNWLF